ncbi:gamma-glutamyl-gamma-aminobutyrate hydrolase family protein [Thalassotalea fonticola]|uniref:Gamma-glutamyl-gamma-aminobutyrate hydrolase family protein n=1 Tax=Thalassotalea fonticola TaxID=3065649 RepID=A0ABZ0GLW3_9GAMM|nr:gamma-glutamyl-gamma-aminobutyrate hydrolase family protein [Colwelliaceae bacterium S1-1]
MNLTKPVVGVVCDVIKYGANGFHGAGEKYINALAHGSNAIPILIPAQPAGEDLESLEKHFNSDFFKQLDGIFLPGSPSNVQPSHYSNEASATPESHDAQRDGSSLPLIKLAIENGIPLLAACRGMQELNVALGGELYQCLHQHEQFIEHREDKHGTRDEQYQTAHQVTLAEDGLFASLLNATSHNVNSLHGQGIKTLGQGLVAEAYAPDGLVEAIRYQGDKSQDEHSFAVGVQWHPEWKFNQDKLSTALFGAFGDAVHKRYLQKHMEK